MSSSARAFLSNACPCRLSATVRSTTSPKRRAPRPSGDLARIEFDPSRDGREIARCVLAWLETGTLGRYDNPHRFVNGRSFLNMPYFGS